MGEEDILNAVMEREYSSDNLFNVIRHSHRVCNNHHWEYRPEIRAFLCQVCGAIVASRVLK